MSKFDFAIGDIYVPGMDGVKLIEAIRSKNPDLPIIAISGVQMATSERTVLDFLPMFPQLSGVLRLKKPFRRSALARAYKGTRYDESRSAR